MTPDPLNVRRPTSEAELLAGSGIVFTPASEYIAALDALALEVATIRELCELLVDWAGARDRVPADDEPSDGTLARYRSPDPEP